MNLMERQQVNTVGYHSGQFLNSWKFSCKKTMCKENDLVLMGDLRRRLFNVPTRGRNDPFSHLPREWKFIQGKQKLINLLKFLNMRSEIGDDPRIPKRFLKMISNSIFVVNDKLYFQIMTADVTLKIVVTGANFIEVWRYKNQHKIQFS